jgi:dihydroorotase
MKEPPLLISGGRIIDPSQGVDMVGDLLIVEGKIAHLGSSGLAPLQGGCVVIPVQGMIVCPGFVDLHCHLREPGFEQKETIATGTQAAARGGFTTVCCMPNTNPPIDTEAVIEFVKSKAKEEGKVRVLPIACITKGQRGVELVEMGKLASSGAVAFSDDGRAVTNSRIMRHALEYSSLSGLPIIVHCEDIALTEGGAMNEGWVATKLGLEGMPAAAEEIMLARDLALAQLTGARLHIAHTSTVGAVELIRQAKGKGISVSAEVTPHHLTLTEQKVMGYETNAKVNPPLRTEKDITALIQGLKEGVIDAIATDHSPHTIADKMCEFGLAAFGISGLETALGSLMTLVHQDKLDLITLISKLTREPAQILGTRPQVPYGLGTLQIEAPGDVTVFAPQIDWVVDPKAFASKGKNTPFKGQQLVGKVMATIVAGKIVYQDEAIEIKPA